MRVEYPGGRKGFLVGEQAAGGGGAAALARLTFVINGQQYGASDLDFSYQPELIISRVSPSAGPVSGETLLRLSGGDFGAGDDLRCRFGRPQAYPFVLSYPAGACLT